MGTPRRAGRDPGTGVGRLPRDATNPAGAHGTRVAHARPPRGLGPLHPARDRPLGDGRGRPLGRLPPRTARGGAERLLPLGSRGLRRLVDHHNAGTVERFDQVVTTTRFAARELTRIGLTSIHIPLGVDLDAFRPPRSRATHPEARLVLCSRLSREKRPDLAIDALSHLLDDGIRATLVVAGDGPRRRSLQRQAARLPVDFVGHLAGRRDVADLLGGGDVVLAPGPIETFGLAALEALACGTAVVASKTSAVRELLVPRAGTCTAPYGSAIAAVVRRLLAVPHAERSAAARARAEEFPWDHTTAMLLDLHRAARAA